MKFDQGFVILSSLFSFRGSDGFFLTIRIVTAILCIPWPFTIVAMIMSLAGHAPHDIPEYKLYLMRLVWLLALVYPLAFFAIILFAEKMLVSRNYGIAVVIALAPIVFSCAITLWMFKSSIFGIAQAYKIVKVDTGALGPDGLPMIFWTIQRGDVSGVSRLLDAGADLEAKGYNGSTPILSAAMVNNWAIVDLLVRRGANISIVDNRGFSLPYLVTQARPMEGTEAEKILSRVRSILKERGMLEQPYEPAQVRDLMKRGQWPR